MKNNKNPTVSVIIPVYNEADALAACLDALAKQTVAPLEVLVVDNNSTDTSAAIARRYPFVTVIRESKQGVVHARSTGFSAARGDILGRIDADSIVSTNWVETLQRIFSADEVAAVSGRAYYGDMSAPNFWNWAEFVTRRWLANRLKRNVFLYGANMAIRKNVWRQIRDQVCTEGDFHEDFDLAVHINALMPGGVIFTHSLTATISARRLKSGFLSFAYYAFLNVRTYARHDVRERFYMYPIIWIGVLIYWPLSLFHTGYDPVKGRFVLRRLWGQKTTMRVNPATFHD